MLGDVFPFAVEDVGMPVGDLGERGLLGEPVLRSVFALSRLEKRPKKPGAMKMFFDLFFWKKKYKEKEEEGVEGSHRWRWSMACAYRNQLNDTLSATPVRLYSPPARGHLIKSGPPIPQFAQRTPNTRVCILPARKATRSECNV